MALAFLMKLCDWHCLPHCSSIAARFFGSTCSSNPAIICVIHFAVRPLMLFHLEYGRTLCTWFRCLTLLVVAGCGCGCFCIVWGVC